jgi:hypothetical protein
MFLKYYLLRLYRKQLKNLAHPSHNKSLLPKLLKILGLKIPMQNLEYWTAQSVYSSSKNFFGEIDYAYLKNNKLIIRGWIFNVSSNIKNMDMIIRGQRHKVILTKEPRVDVVKAFPAENNAYKSGFYLVADWQKRQLMRCSPKFIATLDNSTETGSFRTIEIEGTS